MLAEADLLPLDRERLRRARDGALAVHGDLGLDLSTFARCALAGAVERLRRRGREPDPMEVSHFLAAAALEDVYLAAAAERGAENAWEAVDAGYRSRLEGFLVRRGCSGPEAESAVQDLLGALASPPPTGGARTLLGTFDGSGSLFGWLSLVLLRRVGAVARRRRPTAASEAIESGAAEPMSLVVDPERIAAREEACRRFADALARAWESLTGKERLALVAKHRDGLTQRRVGELLGVGEARVSRIVASAVEKLAGSVRSSLGDESPGEGPLWRMLEAEVASHLARMGGASAPSLRKDA